MGIKMKYYCGSQTVGECDAKSARAKRPLPLRVDSLLPDTALQETEEFGAYMKVLLAMWVSKDVALPKEPRKLARSTGVSFWLWNSQFSLALEGC